MGERVLYLIIKNLRFSMINKKVLSPDIDTPDVGNLEPTYKTLQSMNLDKSPFIIISVIGQELLAQGSYSAAVQVSCQNTQLSSYSAAEQVTCPAI